MILGFVPVWLLAIAPAVALGTGTIWLGAPAYRRRPALRLALIASVALAGLEVLVGILVVGFLMLVSLTGGFPD
jgi:hypothetical protein